MATARQRADVLMVEQGLAPSRARAQALILAGSVIDRTAARVVDKAGSQLPCGNVLALRSLPLPYVSRGGLKLAAALDHFALSPRGAVCLDVGASTGGFTDCLLQRGAQHVTALDVGHNQLAWSLRQHPQVRVLEHCNVRTAKDDAVASNIAFVTIDVSFISLAAVLGSLPRWLVPGAQLVALVKPQFEVGRAEVGKGGIVKSEAARQRAVEKVHGRAVELGFAVQGTLASPVLGAKGNQEFLLAARLR